MRDEGLFTSLVIHYWIGDVQDSQGVSASEMTYIVSGGALNSTHSLTRAPNMHAAVARVLLNLFRYLAVLSTVISTVK